MRVNTISAGPLKSRAASAIGGGGGKKTFIEYAIGYSKANAPLAQDLYADDVGTTGLFLASDLSRCVTGVTLYVDNGLHVRSRGPCSALPCAVLDSFIDVYFIYIFMIRHDSLGSAAAFHSLSAFFLRLTKCHPHVFIAPTPTGHGHGAGLGGHGGLPGLRRPSPYELSRHASKPASEQADRAQQAAAKH